MATLYSMFFVLHSPTQSRAGRVYPELGDMMELRGKHWLEDLGMEHRDSIHIAHMLVGSGAGFSLYLISFQYVIIVSVAAAKMAFWV
ncbi:hypothetical protein C8R43DRAFT_1135062 [Mycena crocata]|nr:hypothetical protein C8R43DRAFT_1135062 [Mycena crocata]